MPKNTNKRRFFDQISLSNDLMTPSPCRPSSDPPRGRIIYVKIKGNGLEKSYVIDSIG